MIGPILTLDLRCGPRRTPVVIQQAKFVEDPALQTGLGGGTRVLGMTDLCSRPPLLYSPSPTP